MKNASSFRLIVFGTIQWISLPVAIAYTVDRNLYSYEWTRDILKTIIFVAIAVSFFWFIVLEIYYWIYSKNFAINHFYGVLVNKKFPNPRNYYFEDGISYFQEVASDPSVNWDIRAQAWWVYGILMGMENEWKFMKCKRMKYAMARAIDKYRHHFEDWDTLEPSFDKKYTHSITSNIIYLLI